MGNEEWAKDAQKRTEETEKLRAEVVRSHQVYEMKQAHKKIEDFEKERKSKTMLSIWTRLNSFADTVIATTAVVNKAIERNAGDNLNTYRYKFECVNKMYESVCYDFKKNLEIRDEDYQKLFPKIEIKLDVNFDTAESLMEMTRQLIHMQYYCQRLL